MTSAVSQRIDTECTVGSPQSERTKALKHSIQIIHNKDGKKKRSGNKIFVKNNYYSCCCQ